MQNINRVCISGHVTRDSELRATQSGTDVLNFSLAVNESRKNQHTGEWEDIPNYIDCTLWGGRANGISRVLKKGVLVCLTGKLHQSSWERDGVKRTKIEVYVDEVEVMRRREEPQEYQAAPSYKSPDAYGDEIPWG